MLHACFDKGRLVSAWKAEEDKLTMCIEACKAQRLQNSGMTEGGGHWRETEAYTTHYGEVGDKQASASTEAHDGKCVYSLLTSSPAQQTPGAMHM